LGERGAVAEAISRTAARKRSGAPPCGIAKGGAHAAAARSAPRRALTGGKQTLRERAVGDDQARALGAYGTRSQRGDGLARLKRTWFEMIGRRSADSIARQRPRPWLLTPTWRADPGVEDAAKPRRLGPGRPRSGSPVELVEVDRRDLQAIPAAGCPRLPRSTAAAGSAAASWRRTRRRPGRTGRCQAARHDPLRFAEAVHLGAVDQRDSELQRAPDERGRDADRVVGAVAPTRATRTASAQPIADTRTPSTSRYLTRRPSGRSAADQGERGQPVSQADRGCVGRPSRPAMASRALASSPLGRASTMARSIRHARGCLAQRSRPRSAAAAPPRTPPGPPPRRASVGRRRRIRPRSRRPPGSRIRRPAGATAPPRAPAPSERHDGAARTRRGELARSSAGEPPRRAPRSTSRRRSRGRDRFHGPRGEVDLLVHEETAPSGTSPGR